MKRKRDTKKCLIIAAVMCNVIYSRNIVQSILARRRRTCRSLRLLPSCFSFCCFYPQLAFRCRYRLSVERQSVHTSSFSAAVLMSAHVVPSGPSLHRAAHMCVCLCSLRVVVCIPAFWHCSTLIEHERRQPQNRSKCSTGCFSLPRDLR